MSSNDNTEQNSSELLENGINLEGISVGEATEYDATDNDDNKSELNEEKKSEEIPQEVETTTVPENDADATKEPSTIETSKVLGIAPSSAIPMVGTAVLTEKQTDILVKNEEVRKMDDNDDGVDDDDDDLFGDGDDDDDDENPVNENEEEVKEPENMVQPEVAVEASASVEAAVPLKFEAQESEVDAKAGDDLKPDNAGPDDVAHVESMEESSTNVSVPIPRKNSGGSSPVGKKMTYTKAALTALGLPDGVNVPYSVDKERLLNNNPNNRKMMDTLRGLPVKLVNDALTEYDDAVQVSTMISN